MPLVSDSATFSAAWRHTEQLRNSASPSFHSLVCLSNVRGVEATVKFATAAPEGVKRSSGSAVRLPTTVIGVSPAMDDSSVWGSWSRWCSVRYVIAREPHAATVETVRAIGGSGQRTSGRMTLVRSTDSFSVS